MYIKFDPNQLHFYIICNDHICYKFRHYIQSNGHKLKGVADMPKNTELRDNVIFDTVTGWQLSTEIY